MREAVLSALRVLPSVGDGEACSTHLDRDAVFPLSCLFRDTADPLAGCPEQPAAYVGPETILERAIDRVVLSRASLGHPPRLITRTWCSDPPP